MNNQGVGFPDYTTRQALISTSSTSGATATAPENGWIFVNVQLDNNTSRTVSINGIEVINTRSGAEYLNGSECGGAYPVKKGATITAVRATVYFCKMAQI